MVLLYTGEEYFTAKHAPYFAIAIFVLLLIVLPPPILLFLYPTQKFQRFLDRFKLRSHFLTTFTDAFQGCYKDSSNGGRDCRSFVWSENGKQDSHCEHCNLKNGVNSVVASKYGVCGKGKNSNLKVEPSKEPTISSTIAAVLVATLKCISECC